KVARELSMRLVVLTGVATGGDGAATRGALPSGNVIAMLPGGMLAVPTNPLLEEVARQGLLISPFPPKMPTRKFMYHMRNQMMVCLADAVLVTSAGKVSGAKMTGGFGLEMGKPTYAFPYTVGTETGEGCNELIKNGASLVESAEDIFPDFNLSPLPKVEEREEQPLSEEEARVMDCFAQAEEVHVETVAEALRMEAYEAGGILTLLETKNKVVRVGGNKYRRV
ncbi:MAG: DNA-processing protein DprA, partial [Christensenellaceae bacterium]